MFSFVGRDTRDGVRIYFELVYPAPATPAVKCLTFMDLHTGGQCRQDGYCCFDVYSPGESWGKADAESQKAR